MRVPGFIYGGNKSQALTADQQRTVNWYVEAAQSPAGRPALYPTPGVSVVSAGGTNEGRAHFFEDDREFAVMGPTLFEIDRDGTRTNRGSIAVDSSPATICSNGDGGDQLFITSGGNGYYYDLATNVLTQITALNGLATMGDYLEGYFLAFDADTSTLYISALLDGSSWTTGTDFAQRNIGADPWVSMKVFGRFVWLLGKQTSEVWYNSGGAFPLSFHPSGFIRYGCAAPFSVAVGDHGLFWLASSGDGDGVVVQANGLTPEVVSSYALETEIAGYDVISNAMAFTYSDLGHSFYVLDFPAPDTTWVLDTALGVSGWAERGTWISEENRYVSWRPRWHAPAFGEHRMLDSKTGNVYRIGPSYLTDVDSRPIRRLRRAPAIQTENTRLFYSSFELDLDVGLGTQTGQGADPQVMMRFSDDAGKTWSATRQRSAGKVGKYSRRVRWNRLGAGRKRVFEIVVTDPIPWRIVDAFVQMAAA